MGGNLIFYFNVRKKEKNVTKKKNSPKINKYMVIIMAANGKKNR